ncbi:MAG: divalent-cation tolerance protein CutA [Nitrospiraceae bacterium]
MDREYSEIVVFVTTSSYEEARKIGNLMVEARLAACASIVEKVRSIFRWEGKISEEQESLIIFKTSADLFEALEERVKKNHSYIAPEIVGLPIVVGSQSYLTWIRDETRNRLNHKE